MADIHDREVLTWQGFGDATRKIAQNIVDSGWMPELVVAVARGGLLPAGALSYALGLKAIGTMNVEFYTDIEETLPEPVLIPPLMDVSALSGKRVLVVDDVADSGKTLELVMRLIRERGIPSGQEGERVEVSEAKCACIYVKSRSIITPDYVLKHTDKWINFPWSTLPPVTAEGLGH
ncbi:MAG: phosphoribosyltransferase [Varibaculum cambriense]|uniref:phosphoribosyltransferase n=1 Tax=Varibaculum cambriense TaxID=184870 RepID=UPI0028FEC13F|nr:phosphoribosyltransferase [Varibaculum cambriense]MDU1050665.1 phosphoribosyltransferase [Varibaculum cambriense]